MLSVTRRALHQPRQPPWTLVWAWWLCLLGDTGSRLWEGGRGGGSGGRNVTESSVLDALVLVVGVPDH